MMVCSWKISKYFWLGDLQDVILNLRLGYACLLEMQAAFENFVGHPVASAVSSRTVSQRFGSFCRHYIKEARSFFEKNWVWPVDSWSWYSCWVDGWWSFFFQAHCHVCIYITAGTDENCERVGSLSVPCLMRAMFQDFGSNIHKDTTTRRSVALVSYGYSLYLFTTSGVSGCCLCSHWDNTYFQQFQRQ